MEKRRYNNIITSLFFIILTCILLISILFLIGSNNKEIKIDSLKLKSGTNIELKENQKILFEVDEKEYSISQEVNEEEYMEILLMNQSFILFLNIEENIDLNNDSIYDIKIMFTKIDGVKYINILELQNQTFDNGVDINLDEEENEEIIEELDEEENEENGNNLNEQIDFEKIYTCINNSIKNSLNLIIENNGFINSKPDFEYKFEGKNIPYLCYTEKNNQRCILQKPNLIGFIENEINENIKNEINVCYPQEIQTINSSAYEIKLKETDEGENKYKIKLIYNFTIITQEIVSQEARYCTSDYSELMEENTWVKISKYVTQENIKIYTIEDKNTNQNFTFAVRGCIV